MEMIAISLVALFASGLTLISGFGLGSLLLPAFILFFPVDIAIGLTAIVHLCNNIFKLWLLGHYADRNVVLRFGIAALLAAFAGAGSLVWLTGLADISISGGWQVSPVKLIVGGLIITFALAELLPAFQNLSFRKEYLVAGGLLSGFLGGLSGHQGALRSAFLLRAGLDKKAFIASGVVIACMVDVSRILVYGRHISTDDLIANANLLIAATISAVAGAVIGRRIMEKMTMTGVRYVVAAALIILALAWISGII